MFWGKKRKKATQEAVRLSMPLVEIAALPPRSSKELWDNSYFVGFVYGTIGVSTVFSVGEQLSTRESERVITDTMEAIAGEQASNALEKIASCLQTSDHRFMRGIENAKKFMLFSYGLDDFVGDGDVDRARELAPSLEKAGIQAGIAPTSTTERGKVANALFKILFSDQIDS